MDVFQHPIFLLGELMNINVELFYLFNHAFQNPFFDYIMPVFTHFGGFKFLILVLIAIVLYAHLRNKRTLRKIIFLTLIALLFSDGIAFVLKHLIHEPRPFLSLDNVHLLIAEDDPLSFPSGHTTSTIAIVTFLVFNMKELAKKHYKIINVCLIIFAILIPFSRMYIGVHYPGDVLAGAAIGIVGAVIVNHFKCEILNRIDILNKY